LRRSRRSCRMLGHSRCRYSFLSENYIKTTNTKWESHSGTIHKSALMPGPRQMTAMPEDVGQKHTPYSIVKVADSDDGTSSHPWYRTYLPRTLGTPVGILGKLLSLRVLWLLWVAIRENGTQKTFVSRCFLGLQISLFSTSAVHS